MEVVISTNRLPFEVVVSSPVPDAVTVIGSLPMNVTVSVVMDGKPGATGAPGKSEYQSAVDNGFEGTEAEWVQSRTQKTFEQLRSDNPVIAGNIDFDKLGTATNLQPAVNDDDALTFGQGKQMRDTAILVAEEYTDQEVTSLRADTDTAIANAVLTATAAANDFTNQQLVGVYKPAGDWDASTGTWPLTRGSGAAIKRGDTFNVIVPGYIGLKWFDAGDQFYANMDAPGQNPARWGKFEQGTDQGTEAARGTFKIISDADIQDENTVNNSDVVTGTKFWKGIAWLKSIAQTITAIWTFNISPRWNFLSTGQYIKTDGTKSFVSVSSIPATDIGSLDATHRWWTDALATTLAGKENTANKQNSLVADGTGIKFPTVDATNAALALKQDDLWEWQRTRGIMFWDDFLGGAGGGGFSFANASNGIVSANSGAGSGSTFVVGRTNGWRSQFTGSTAAGQAVLSYASGGSYYTSFGAVVIESLVDAATLSISTDRFFYLNGFLNATSNYISPTAGIFFLYDEGNVWGFGALGGSPNWKCVTLNGSGRVSTTTAVPVSLNGQYKLRIEINAAGTQIQFFINGTLVATHATFIPIPTVGISWVSVMNKSVGTTSASFYIDYFGYKHTFGNVR